MRGRVTLEDEIGVASLVIWPSRYEKQRRLILTASIMGVEGTVQREGEVVHVVVSRLHDLSGELAGLGKRGPVWWRDGAPDYNRHLTVTTPYADWYAALARPTQLMEPQPPTPLFAATTSRHAVCAPVAA